MKKKKVVTMPKVRAVPVGRPNGKLRAAMLHIDALIRLAGLDSSESATEVFAAIMLRAAMEANQAVRRSHREGLCYDTRWFFGEALITDPDNRAFIAEWKRDIETERKRMAAWRKGKAVKLP